LAQRAAIILDDHIPGNVISYVLISW